MRMVLSQTIGKIGTPLTLRLVSKSKMSSSEMPLLNPNFKTKNASILVVDDSLDNLRVLSATLSASNYDIRCAKSGSVALKAITTAPPDLILLDIQMPDLNGYEVCQQLKANVQTRHIPIIFISALDEALDKVKAFSVGGIDYITKPFQVGEVLARVRNQLDLQVAKMQLAQSEKMASLGQLVAGIAHEINNPINFIHGNLDVLEVYVQDLLRLIEAYQQEHSEPSETISSITQEIDLDYLKTDLPKITDSMRVGTERVTNIVQLLRNFSRLDEQGYKPVDIHQGLEDTLLILASRLNSPDLELSTEIVRNYGDLSPVSCHPAALNQVFMNLIANAIDAVEDRLRSQPTHPNPTQSYQPKITLKTEQTAKTTTIQIEDNGCGMSGSTQSCLFSPFFTTKPVGKGTGMGLSISYQIIKEKHQGQLTCQSQYGVGTQFTIELPVETVPDQTTGTVL